MFLTFFFEYVCVQNNMGVEVENKVANKIDANLKLIKEWIHKTTEKIDVSLKATVGIKE